jgi:Transposase
MEAMDRMPSEQLSEAALGVSSPWYVRETRFDAAARTLTIQVDFRAGSRFGHLDAAGAHAVHDTQTKRYRAPAAADFSEVRELAIDETSKARGHDDVRIAADAERRAVIFVTETREAQAIERLAADLTARGGDPEAVQAVSIDTSPVYIKGMERHLPNATVTLDAKPNDQKLPGGSERAVPDRQTQAARLSSVVDHPNGHLPDRRKTRLPNTQPASRLTHSKFKRAQKGEGSCL